MGSTLHRPADHVWLLNPPYPLTPRSIQGLGDTPGHGGRRHTSPRPTGRRGGLEAEAFCFSGLSDAVSSRSPGSALSPLFWGEGSPAEINYRRKGTPILTSLLEDLVLLVRSNRGGLYLPPPQKK